MHMADALISPVIGGTMWVISGGAIAFCSRKLRSGLDDRRVPLMGVLGAFVFAAQMINFTIPVTGSSGHLGGGLLLAILLGPHAAFLVISSVLVVQALLFADGGLLALGCNIFNLGLIPAFIAYPFIYKKLAKPGSSPRRIVFAAILTAVAGMQLGAFGVVLETALSGISELSFFTFLLLMQPIHLAIGIAEGIVTAAVVSFVLKAHPEIAERSLPGAADGQKTLRPLLSGFLVAALITGGVFSWCASEKPDGLEWSVARLSGKAEIQSPQRGIHEAAASLQGALALLPEYKFKMNGGGSGSRNVDRGVQRAGTSVSGILGGIITLGLVCGIGCLLKHRRNSAG